MGDAIGLGLTGWMIGGAVLGLGIGWERVANPDADARRSLGLNLILAAWWAAIVAIEATSIRGFALMFLSSVGAYKIAALIAEYVALRLGMGRSAS